MGLQIKFKVIKHYVYTIVGSSTKVETLLTAFDVEMIQTVSWFLYAEQSTPLITVMCTESKSDAQTTTAAQRTTSSPTTIATPTTVTPTTTTTSQTVTTIVKTDTSVHSPDQTLLVLCKYTALRNNQIHIK